MADLSITAADVRPVEIFERETLPAGEAITAGQYVHADTSARVMKTNASEDPVGGGIALRSVAANLAVTWVRKGLVFLGAALDSLDYGAKVFASATDGGLTATSPAANEKDTVTISGTPTGGTFTIGVDGVDTTALAYNANAATVQAALEVVVGSGNVVVSGTAPYTLTFIQDYGQTPVTVTADGSSLTGGTTPAAVAAQVTAGAREILVGYVEAVAADTTPLKALRLG